MKKENTNLFSYNVVKFRQKPFLQAGGVPTCALPYDVWCVVNNVGISSIKMINQAMGAGQEGQSR